MTQATTANDLVLKIGRSYPLGATWDGKGVNFAVFSETADAVELCLFDSVQDKSESHRLFLPAFSDHVWHGYVVGLKPGQLYGYRVHGPWNPLGGQYFNHNKVLLDPYAKAIARTENWEGKIHMFAYKLPIFSPPSPVEEPKNAEPESNADEASGQDDKSSTDQPEVKSSTEQPEDKPTTEQPEDKPTTDQTEKTEEKTEGDVVEQPEGEVSESVQEPAPEVPLEDADLIMDTTDNAAFVPLGAVIDNSFDWGDTQAPEKNYHRSIIYEAHVKGLTMLHPEIPEDIRGTYAGMAAPPIIKHLKDLGITAIELLPVHSHLTDPFLYDKGMENYWGYSTLAFFAPEFRYASKKAQEDPQGSVREFKSMVKAFHEAGIEVILDVVYNHTCEGNHKGPMFSFRGFDNLAYYKHMPDAPRYYKDFSGCGNSLNVHHPRVLQMIVDSLRYWATEMHINGFRFDLAPVLGRDFDHFDPGCGFFDIVRQDPILSVYSVKMIAEPWDLGPDGYCLGRFPTPWTEWNGKYRDIVRRFWKGDRDLTGDFATRICGSNDYFHYRFPYNSINFVTCHDGFTLEDLVTYNGKHNDANGENNNDGENENSSWNCGEEGPTENPDVKALRARQKRNYLATLLLSMGVPMLLSGDEMGRTQQGNNNCYCQDNELSWQNWDLSEENKNQLAFVQKVANIRRQHAVFQRRNFLSGKRAVKPSLALTPGEIAVAEEPLPKTALKDSVWYSPMGHIMYAEDWAPGTWMSVGVFLNGRALNELDEDNNPITGESFLLLMNATDGDATFQLPALPVPTHVRNSWHRVLDTTFETGEPSEDDKIVFLYNESYPLQARSLALLMLAQTDISELEENNS